MKQMTYTRTEIHERKGYIYDGTFECAKNICKEIQEINPEYAKPFTLRFNLFNNSTDFNWGGYIIKENDLVAFRDDANMMHEVIEIVTPEELKRWGYKEK